MPRTEASSMPPSAAPTVGGRTTAPCTIPGTRTLWTNSNCPVAIAGMSRRATGVPSTFHSPGALRGADASIGTLNCFPATSSPYVTRFERSAVTTIVPSAAVS